MRVEAIVLACVLLAGCPGGDDAPMRTDAGTGPDAGPPPEGLYDLFEIMADPAGPAKRTVGIAELASSRQVEPPERFENLDWLEFAATPGDDAVLLEAEGPGAITRFWLTMRANVRELVFVGVLGGFTTFSTFGLETFLLSRTESAASALLNVAAHVGVGLLAVWAGYQLGVARS